MTDKVEKTDSLKKSTNKTKIDPKQINPNPPNTTFMVFCGDLHPTTQLPQ